MPRRTRQKKPAYPPKRFPRMRAPRMRMAPGTDYAVRGMVDMSKVAVTGVVGAGMIGMVGSLLHP
jgi:hypothetical protein